MVAYDGNKTYTVQPGDYVIARKNHLVRYTKYQGQEGFRHVIIAFDEAFLRKFLERHPVEAKASSNDDSFLFIREDDRIAKYIQSLAPYYNGGQELDETFADIKREELLLILLKNDPALGDIFFNFGAPEKLDLKAFMNKNFRFNISLERFAFLTGRSLSSFKREFQKVFGDNPGSWLKQRRLKEAYFQISTNHVPASDVYLDLGFEDLSHFSYAFKKEFGVTPTEAGRHRPKT